jgi:hypothetical protein
MLILSADGKRFPETLYSYRRKETELSADIREEKTLISNEDRGDRGLNSRNIRRRERVLTN